MAVVVKDWMVSPQVTTLDLSAYNKHVGDVISIAAQDDFEVTGVTVAIEDSTHMVVENGAAVYDAARPVEIGWWQRGYVARGVISRGERVVEIYGDGGCVGQAERDGDGNGVGSSRQHRDAGGDQMS